MVLQKLFPFKFTCVLAFLFCVSTLTVKSQIQDCSIQSIDLRLCMKQNYSSFSIEDSCCQALNKAVRIGYICLCLLASEYVPLFNSPIILPFSDCFISVPPLSLCKAELYESTVLAPNPMVFVPNSTNQLTQPFLPPENVLVISPPPPQAVQITLNITREENFTKPATETQPIPSENANPKFNMSKDNVASNEGDKFKIFFLKSVFLSSLLHGCIIFA